ncbi:MAG: hypothetical protein HY942_09430 [Gammaproteobacteria bacterium]|nr:hypothetical protein [Gammaproteobacteria bacterium]
MITVVPVPVTIILVAPIFMMTILMAQMANLPAVVMRRGMRPIAMMRGNDEWWHDQAEIDMMAVAGLGERRGAEQRQR